MSRYVVCREVWQDLAYLADHFRTPEFKPAGGTVDDDTIADPEVPFLEAVTQFFINCIPLRTSNIALLANHVAPPGWKTYKYRWGLPNLGKSKGARIVVQWCEADQSLLVVAVKLKRYVEDQAKFLKTCNDRIRKYHGI